MQIKELGFQTLEFIHKDFITIPYYLQLKLNKKSLHQCRLFCLYIGGLMTSYYTKLM